MSAKKQMDKHSRTGVSGAPKKGGGGGKGVWGVGGLDDLKTTPLSKDDPNYVSSEEEDYVLEKVDKLPNLVTPYEDICKEYFSSGDGEEAKKKIQELSFSDTEKTQFVKKVLVFAVERHAYERELTSKLLSQLYGNVLSLELISNGFQAVLLALEDLVLDSPDAAEVVGKFLARAVMDEVIPPSFLKNAEAPTSVAKEAIALANGMTTEKHRSGRLEHIWGPGDLSSVKRLKEEVSLLLEEFLSNSDLNEAEKSLRSLNTPSFHFQVVKLAIRLGLNKGATQRDQLHKFLSKFAKIGLLSPEAIKQGFAVCYENIKDLQLDVPDAQKILDEFAEQAKNEGYLEK